MGNLFIFGDSFSYGDGCKPGDPYYEITKPNKNKIWPEFLKDELNLKLLNYAERGSSNQETLRKITQNIDKINKNDIVIIGITDFFRFEVFNNMNYYRVMFETFSNLDDISKLKYSDDEDWISEDWIRAIEEYMKYIHLPNNLLYIQSISKSITSISNFLKNNSIKVILWTWDHMSSKQMTCDWIQLKDEYSIFYEYPSINDMHYSWYGHHEIYKIMLNKLK